MATTYSKITYDGKKVQVDSAVRDGNGKQIDTNYQEKLTSGSNIKTVNGNSLLGSGDITIQSGGDVEKINVSSFLNNTDNLSVGDCLYIFYEDNTNHFYSIVYYLKIKNIVNIDVNTKYLYCDGYGFKVGISSTIIPVLLIGEQRIHVFYNTNVIEMYSERQLNWGSTSHSSSSYSIPISDDNAKILKY